MNRTMTTILFSLTIFLLTGSNAFSAVGGQSAGSTTASITGTIADEQGAIITDAVVTARNIQTNFIREVQTDKDGSFVIAQLPPDTYSLTVKAEGFITRTSRLNLSLGTTTICIFNMKIGPTSDVVEVTGDNLIIEGKTESSSNNSRDRIDNLPINMRNFLDFTLTTPRVVRDRVPVQGITATSGLSFNGQSARFNNITIDGVDNNDRGGGVRSTFSQDAVLEFQVVSDSYSAEFGRALGGIVNIVTRAGSNEFHGNLFLLNRNASISARAAFSSVNSEFEQYQFGSTLSGPIKRDRIFFFSSLERLSVKQNNIITISDPIVGAARRQGFELQNGPVPFSLDSTMLLGRLDARISPANSLWIRYNFGGTYNGAIDTFGGLSEISNGGLQRLSDNSVAVSNTYISTGLNLVNETRFLYGHIKQDLLPYGNGPQVRIAAPEGLVTFGRTTFLPQVGRINNNYQIVNNVTLTSGRNQIKFGIDYEHFPQKGSLLTFDEGFATFTPFDFSPLTGIPNSILTGPQNFDPALRTSSQRAFLTVLAERLPRIVPGFPQGLPLADMAIPVTYAQGFGSPTLKIDASFLSLFFQADIRLRPNLVLKPGVRYDLNRLRFMPKNNGNLSPRLALSYRPSILSKLNMRASYGFFFSAPLTTIPFAAQIFSTGLIKLAVIPFPFSILPFALPGHRFPPSDQIPGEVNFIPQLSQTLIIQRDLRNGYAQQSSAGFDYSISNNTAISVTYDFVRGLKFIVPRNINPVVRPVPGNPLLSAITGRVDPRLGIVNEYESAFDSYYHGLTVSINRRFTNRIGFLAHYTFSKAIDNYIDIRTDLQEVDNSLRPRDERGLSLQDVRSRFVLSGVFDLSYTKNPLLNGFQLSTIINLNSGRPYNLLAGVDLNRNGDNPPGDRPLVGGVSLGRNVGITPGFASVDLRLQRALAIGERFRLQGFVEVFNMFNRVNISEVARVFPPDAQGRFNLPRKDGGRFIAEPAQFRNAFAPRQFQLGFRFTF
jgi:hypothetical protein